MGICIGLLAQFRSSTGFIFHSMRLTSAILLYHDDLIQSPKSSYVHHMMPILTILHLGSLDFDVAPAMQQSRALELVH